MTDDTQLRPPKPKYPTRYERVLRRISESNRPMNPLLMFARSALGKSPRRTQVVRKPTRKPMSKMKSSIIYGIVSLGIVLGFQFCSRHHIGVVSAKHTMGR